MSMKHEIQIRALEERCSALESRLAAIEAELHRTSGEELVRTTGSDRASKSWGGWCPECGGRSVTGTPDSITCEYGHTYSPEDEQHGIVAVSKASVSRRPGRGPARYDVTVGGTTINTEALKLEDAETLASQQNQALEGLDTTVN